MLFSHELLCYLASKKALTLSVNAAPQGHFTGTEVELVSRPPKRVPLEGAFEDLATFLSEVKSRSNRLREVALLPFGRECVLL